MKIYSIALDLRTELAPPSACVVCGSAALEPVFDGDKVNFFCGGCHVCWSPSGGSMSRVAPQGCQQCSWRERCLTWSATRARGGPIA